MAEVLVGGQPFTETVAFFTDELGFRLQLITPADDPRLAVVEGLGLRLRIERDRAPGPITLVVEGEGPARRAPNGAVVEFVPPRALAVPPLQPELVVAPAGDDGDWIEGRAGMRYRDLLPSRLGGRFIASHIEVCDGGPVADLVHHHDIRFQLIFCHQGWVDVVYQGQGPPFRLEAGDAVLQPPGLRHEVLASAAGARVVEIGCPAEHDTWFDHELRLPDAVVEPDRRHGGQRFVRHVGAEVAWAPSADLDGFEVQQTEIAAATDGLAGVRVLRPASAPAPTIATAPTAPMGGRARARSAAELQFFFVLDGTVELVVDDGYELATGAAAALPPSIPFELRAGDPGLRLLEVTLPA
ncbi:MAG: AraC family ligand binding domain-containing protein [Actinomycetota bacterium]